MLVMVGNKTKLNQEWVMANVMARSKFLKEGKTFEMFIWGGFAAKIETNDFLYSGHGSLCMIR
jgi:hypothetical protein